MPDGGAESGSGATVAPVGAGSAAAATEAIRATPFPADAASRIWLQRLSSDGFERETAVQELHALLVRAARFVLAKRRATSPQASSWSLDELAMEAADDALVAVLARLPDFRGESRFTTWASKFALLEASMALRRRTWIGREIGLEDAGWTLLSRDTTEQQVEERELLRRLRRAVEVELTPNQRAVFVALALNHVPIDVLAERLGTTRGALYKMLHDARRKLRAHLDGS
jgi:RNA polymerase sigma-70 factor (ECF subfamily)